MGRLVAAVALMGALLSCALPHQAWAQASGFGDGLGESLSDLSDALYRQSLEFFRSSAKYGNDKDAIPPVVVEFSPTRLNSVDMMEEDLAVMARIIEKALDGELGAEEAPVKSGIRMWLTGGGRSVRAMYVEGVGPLFMIKVNFPLLAPPKVEEKKAEDADGSEWEKTWRELKGVPEEETWTIPAGRESAYNEEQVRTLKRALLSALKHAAHMRQLRPEDFVAVSVFGSSSFTLTKTSSSRSKSSGSTSSSARKSRSATQDKGPADADSDSPAKPSAVVDVQLAAPAAGQAELAPGATESRAGRTTAKASSASKSRRDSGQGSVLTLRAKKADVDLFAKGDLTFDAFEDRVTANAYPGSGYGITSVNSWMIGPSRR
jgi:hypothetical protein